MKSALKAFSVVFLKIPAIHKHFLKPTDLLQPNTDETRHLLESASFERLWSVTQTHFTKQKPCSDHTIILNNNRERNLQQDIVFYHLSTLYNDSRYRYISVYKRSTYSLQLEAILLDPNRSRLVLLLASSSVKNQSECGMSFYTCAAVHRGKLEKPKNVFFFFFFFFFLSCSTMQRYF